MYHAFYRQHRENLDILKSRSETPGRFWNVVLGKMEKRNTLRTGERRKDNWIGHILRRNCLLKHANEGKI